MSDQHDGNKLEQSLKRAGSQWREDDLDEILALLEKDYTQPEQRRSLEKVQSLLQEDSPVEMFGCGPILSEDEETVPEEPEAAQEEAPPVPPTTTLGTAAPEQADFTDAPVKQRDPRTTLTLAIVAAAEAVALAGLVFWWLRWLK